MTLPGRLFRNPVLTALETTHAHLAIRRGEAARYPAAVAPFAAVSAATTGALCDLRALLAGDEHVWVAGIGEAEPHSAGLRVDTSIDVLQMVLPGEAELPPPNPRIIPLDCGHAAEMVALTDIAFPGFFRPRTCEMGAYFGIRSPAGGRADEPEGQLIAMGGERLVFPGYSEISGLCTHPDHRGLGYAAHLVSQVARLDRSRGVIPWLHVTATNAVAVNLYLKLGFQTVRGITLYKLSPA